MKRGCSEDLREESEIVKDKVKHALQRKPPYNVHDFYHTTGLAQRIARHSLFDTITLFVIALNAAWLWVDTDYNDAVTLMQADTVFQVAEHAFCSYFFLEWVVRFMAFKRKCNGLKDGWFVFDTALVFLGVLETWVLLVVMEILNSDNANPLGGQSSTLRLFRLLRLTRLLRMLRSLPELMILVKGMKTAMTSVSYVICLLAIITYVFAIAITQLSAGTDMHLIYFDHVSLSMYSLIVHGTFVDDLSELCNDVRKESPLCLVLLFAFISLACCTMMNMLIGVLCEVVSAVATFEKEERLTTMVSEKMHQIVHSLDTDTNYMISYEEFRQILDLPEALQVLAEVGVDPVGIVDFAELFFFEEGKPIQQNFPDFMKLVLDLRSTNHATVKDVKHLWLQVKSKLCHTSREMQETREMVARIDDRTARMEGQLAELLEEVRRCKVPSETKKNHNGVSKEALAFEPLRAQASEPVRAPKHSPSRRASEPRPT